MNTAQPFAPSYGSGSTVVLAAATPQTITLSPTDSTVRIVNSGANSAYAKVGLTGVLASSTSGIYLPPTNSITVFLKPQDAERSFMSLISTSGTTLQVITGMGGI